jgi:hypothetical protein
MIEGFPSESHYRELTNKGLQGRVVDEDLWAWQAYDYGWRRIMLYSRDDRSPIDPQRQWYDTRLAADAEIFFSKKFGKRCPPLAPSHSPDEPPKRTKEELAYVDACMREVKANLAAFLDAAVMAPRATEQPDALQRIRDALGVTATEAAE